MLRSVLPCLALGLLPFVPFAAGPSTTAVAPATAAQDFSGVTIEAELLGIGTWMLTGAGGNMGLLVGDDGALLIDDQFGPLSDKILATIASKTDLPLRWVLNTHWHGDHTGGNANLSATGAVIVAHEAVRKRMSTEQSTASLDRTTSASPAEALPDITFTKGLELHWNGQKVRLIHVAAAHTDGDSFVHLTGANVLHMGDCFSNGMYPFIDRSSGGSIDGVIAAANTALGLVNNHTAIIPGHGPLANRHDLRSYRDMLVKARTAIAALIDDGFNRDEVIAAHPTRDLDEQWGGGFMEPDVWVGILFDSLSGS